MKKRVIYLIPILLIMALMVGCSEAEVPGQGTKADTLPVITDAAEASTELTKTTSASETKETTKTALSTVETEETTETKLSTEEVTTEENVSTEATEAETEVPTLPVSTEEQTPSAETPLPTQPSKDMTPAGTTEAETTPYIPPATEPLTTQEPETTVVERSFHMVQTTYACYDAARQKGLNEKLEAAGSNPVFRLNATNDVSLFCALFKNETELVEGIIPYDQTFFADNVLFVIHMETGSSSNTEERFQVEKRIQNRVLHLRVSCTYPSGFIKGDRVCSWLFVPMDRGTADSLIAYDATWTNDSLPPDWTEPINPDWRTH